MESSLRMPTPDEVRAELARTWKWVLVSGILALALGTIAILVPIVASVAVTTLVGWLLIIGGVIGAIESVRMRSESGWRLALRLLLMALYVVAGLWLVIEPWTGTIALTAVLVAYLWVDGVIRLAVAFSERGSPGWSMLAIGGALSLLLGVLIWVDLPSSSGWAIGLLVGINLIVLGWSQLAAAMVGRAEAKGDSPERVAAHPA